MTAPDVVLEIVDVLRRRLEIVECLTDEARDKRSLDEELDIARSTLDRAVRELEAIELVAYVNGKYTLTPVGERLALTFFAFLERIELAMELEPFLQWAPVDEFDLDLRLLADAEVVDSEEGNPHAMIDRHVQRLEQMERTRAMLPIVGLHAHETAHERIVEHGAEVELIVEPCVAEVMFTDPSFAELTEEMVATGRLDLHVSEEPIPYFVGVIDDETVQIGVDEDGEPRAILETGREEIRLWAHETIDAYKRRSAEPSQATVGSKVSA